VALSIETNVECSNNVDSEVFNQMWTSGVERSSRARTAGRNHDARRSDRSNRQGNKCHEYDPEESVVSRSLEPADGLHEEQTCSNQRRDDHNGHCGIASVAGFDHAYRSLVG
jgi:hypothetical protein